MKGKEGAHSVLSFAPHFRLENVTCALALTATYGSFVMLESITASFPSNHASCSRARLKIPNFVIKGFTFSFQNDFLVAIASWLQWRFVSYPSRWVLAELTVQQGINKVRLLRWTFRSAFQCSGKKGMSCYHLAFRKRNFMCTRRGMSKPYSWCLILLLFLWVREVWTVPALCDNIILKRATWCPTYVSNDTGQNHDRQ